MLSCDPRLALCTFVQLVCPALPCPFGWVSRLRACVRSRSGGALGGNWSGGSGEGAPGRTSPYQKMLSCDPRLALCTFVQLVCPALPCRFVSASRLRARARTRSRGSGEGAPGRTSPYQKMLSCGPGLALCTLVQLVCPALPCRFVSVSRLRARV